MGRVDKLYESVRNTLAFGVKIKAIVVGSKLLKLLLDRPNVINASINSEIPIYEDTDFKPYQFEIEVEEDAKKKDND